MAGHELGLATRDEHSHFGQSGGYRWTIVHRLGGWRETMHDRSGLSLPRHSGSYRRSASAVAASATTVSPTSMNMARHHVPASWSKSGLPRGAICAGSPRLSGLGRSTIVPVGMPRAAVSALMSASFNALRRLSSTVDAAALNPHDALATYSL